MLLPKAYDFGQVYLPTALGITADITLRQPSKGEEPITVAMAGLSRWENER